MLAETEPLAPLFPETQASRVVLPSPFYQKPQIPQARRQWALPWEDMVNYVCAMSGEGICDLHPEGKGALTEESL